MSTALAARPARTASKTLAVARAYFANPWTTIATPLVVLAAVLLLNITIWAIISANLHDAGDRADFRDGVQWSGASSWMFVYMFVLAVQAITAQLPFALSYGATRRQFLAATGIVYLVLSVGYATLYTLLALVERVSNGWGFSGRMFTAVYFGADSWVARWLTFFALLLACFLVGSAFAAVYQRWRRTGLLLAFAVVAALVVGGAALLTLTEGWVAFGAGIASAWTSAGDLALPLFTTPFVVVGGLVTWLVVRRATITT
ncbi:hypothetical protein QT381_14255 [Galbitalea sp. SE-J8]|uniref:hypothetical protein n=1 Tax=Galbitalea sp. SE-J8 TaxID=3054952 RepID=UPI00259CD7F4|nr:hypothetical protein [Galbitalea sp. SE-J8]MDM4764169.1 hypothetical protein [Galbitalea sp. SE-J8]